MELISAIATGTAATAVGIIRVSGDGCFSACDRVFRPANGNPLSSQEARKLIYGELLDNDGTLLDRGLAVRFPAPHSYTGEDCVELDCHGSPVVLREVLHALFAVGARQARAGEFTKRAFFNGRMDLTEAEAVMDLIDAETPGAAKNAAAQLDGALRRPLESVQEALLDVASRFYAVVDYPDEDIEDIRPEDLASALRRSDETLTALLATCERGRVLKSGVRTAIIGRPNAGKSSLLNALAGRDRAIVTDIPGTTRDTVEESVLCGGVPLRLIDTAGIRDAHDAVEKLGIARSRAAAETAELILAVVDGTQDSLLPEDKVVLALAAQCSRWILVLSKRDVCPTPTTNLFCWKNKQADPAASVFVSSVTGEGLDQLSREIAALFPLEVPGEAGSLLTDARQEDAASRARDAVRQASQAFRDGMTPDAVLTDVEEALNALGELTGRTAREDMVERIFSRFCVGK